MDDLYRENILEHYKHPRHWGELEDPDLEFFDTNPLCGDELKVQIKVDAEGRVADVEQRGALISFAVEGIHPHDVAEILGRQGVCVRAGHHCAQPLMRRLGVPATSRASFAVHSTREEVDALIDGIAAVQEVFA